MTDTELLDALQKCATPDRPYFVCRNSVTGRGLRIHVADADSMYHPKPTIREAIEAYLPLRSQKGKI